jgi:hypothetical protein
VNTHTQRVFDLPGVRFVPCLDSFTGLFPAIHHVIENLCFSITTQSARAQFERQKINSRVGDLSQVIINDPGVIGGIVPQISRLV